MYEFKFKFLAHQNGVTKDTNEVKIHHYNCHYADITPPSITASQSKYVRIAPSPTNEVLWSFDDFTTDAMT